MFRQKGGIYMSKKKRRYEKRKKRRNKTIIVCKRKDTHHILWQKCHWKGKYSRLLREYYYCKVEIPKDTLHRQIHLEVNEIPVPSEKKCKYALTILEELSNRLLITPDDSFELRLNLLIGIFRDEPKIKEALEKQLAIVCEFYKPS